MVEERDAAPEATTRLPSGVAPGTGETSQQAGREQSKSEYDAVVSVASGDPQAAASDLKAGIGSGTASQQGLAAPPAAPKQSEGGRGRG